MADKIFFHKIVCIASGFVMACCPSLWSQAWVQKTNLPAGRSGSVGFTINDKIYLADGSNDASFLTYDPAMNVWTALTDLPSGRAAHHGGISFVVNGKAYVGLGVAGNWQQNLWEFDPSNNMWTQKASLPSIGREGAACFVMNNKAYIVGGAEVNRIRQVWAYDPANDSWTAKGNFPAGPIIYATGFTINNKGYIQGGYPDDLANNVTNRIYEYDDAMDHWSLKAACPGPGRQGHASFVIGGKAYLGLGVDRDYQQYYTDFYCYDPTANTWSPSAGFPAAGRMFAIAVVAGGKGYVGTGTTIGDAFNDFFAFDPDGATGLAEYNEREAAIICYPNPATDELHVSGLTGGGSVPYFIYDLNGRKISSGYLSSRTSISVTNLTKGAYLLTLQNGKGFTTKTFIKNN